LISGVGIDLVHIPRFERIARKWEARFLDRLFTEQEKKECLRRANPYPSLAARFAAKEAFFKASSRLSVLPWKEIEVVSRKSGQPFLLLHGSARTLHQNNRIHLSLSHDGDHAAAQVVIEHYEAPVKP